jgi:ribosomal protein L18
MATDDQRLKRKKRIRKKVNGTAERPRMSVFRSAKHIYAQVIDDTKGETLVHVSTLSKDLKAVLTTDEERRGEARGSGDRQGLQGQGHRQGRLRPQRLPLPRAQ